MRSRHGAARPALGPGLFVCLRPWASNRFGARQGARRLQRASHLHDFQRCSGLGHDPRCVARRRRRRGGRARTDRRVGGRSHPLGGHGCGRSGRPRFGGHWVRTNRRLPPGGGDTSQRSPPGRPVPSRPGRHHRSSYAGRAVAVARLHGERFPGDSVGGRLRHRDHGLRHRARQRRDLHLHRGSLKRNRDRGPTSASSNAVTTPDVPGAPTGVVAVAGNQKASLNWEAPAPRTPR